MKSFVFTVGILLGVIGSKSYTLAQQSLDTVRLYTEALEQVKTTQEYLDYMIWSGEETPYVSGEILFASELIFSCPKCSWSTSEGSGVKYILPDLILIEDRDEYKSVAFFTEIKEDCFAIILKTTYNNEAGFEEGIFVGKQAYFQFYLDGTELKSCSRITLRNN